MRFTGKVAVITGGAQGIGRSTAERFLAEGAKVVIADIDESRLTATAKEIGTPDTVLAIRTDVAKKADVDAMIAAAVARFGRIDILLNNAGICPVADFLDFTEEQYDQTLAVNLRGAFFGTQGAGRQMIAQGGGGVIINMSSINSGLANPVCAPYAISKGGMNQVTTTAAVAFAPHGIRVCGVGPGTIATEIIKGAFTERAGMNAILSRTPIGRLGEPEEIAAVVAFLASDDASYITGETIYPDGGRRILNYTVPVKE
ncbi:glucose 1-dehydrogenase [Frigidibacter albus]|uniref:Glucose 1-dehydrogenase n=1 Tax=Frigidibacter albus TaxID=1465486 RepID=A0A6L8VHX7_9RHOB|nr:SDR family oxidoreductase [Frigidibacter albus]MZQ89296.1 glucose 1-dehydrogenase [Frigidibacter albus]NBE31202.1 glucose 1-dehydrogenase [Frigidibacter albus]GGH53459.1 dehydrogenase [Frigidibacter albus]